MLEANSQTAATVFMTTLPSSQALEPVPAIFKHPDGSDWRIFVEAAGIISRPKLVRTLKKAGAEVHSDPKLAQIILVDPSTNQGKLFIRDWGSDQNKVVLDCVWVQKCLSEQRVLDERDDWGGCLTRDDGLPIMEDWDEEISNSLPTPRITPVGTLPTIDRSSASNKGCPSSSTRIIPATSTERPEPPTCISSESQSSMLNSLECNSSSSSPGLPLPVQGTQPTPSQSHPVFTAQAQSTLGPYRAFPNVAPFPSQPNPSAFHDPSQFLMNLMAPQANTLLGPHYEAFSLALMDAMKSHMMTMNSFPPSNNLAEPRLNLPSSNVSQGITETPPATSTLITDTIRSRSPRSPPDAYSETRTSSPATIGEKRRRYSKGSEHMDQSEKTLSYPSPHLHNSLPCASTVSQPQQSHPLFRDESGNALTFFVQIDLHNRFSVVNAIKKNGGMILNDHTSADYTILYSRSKAFPNLLRSTAEAGKLAISAAFIHDSIAQNTVLNSTSYAFEVSAEQKGKKKRASLARDEQPAEVQETQERRRKRRRSIPETGSNVDAPPTDPRLRSPTPPAETTRTERKGRGYFFSEHEREYTLRYVDVLLRRDHQTSLTAIAQRLYKKMNHHSAASWRAYLFQTLGDEVAIIRKRRSIAYRKSLAMHQPSGGSSGGSGGLAGEAYAEEPEEQLAQGLFANEEVRTEDPLELDMQRISNFFAFEGGDQDNEDEAAVWAALTGRTACLTAGSWEAFYNEHHVEVQRRYQELLHSTEDAVDVTAATQS